MTFKTFLCLSISLWGIFGPCIQAKSIEAKSIEAKSIEAKSIEAKSIEAKSIEAKSSEIADLLRGIVLKDLAGKTTLRYISQTSTSKTAKPGSGTSAEMVAENISLDCVLRLFSFEKWKLEKAVMPDGKFECISNGGGVVGFSSDGFQNTNLRLGNITGGSLASFVRELLPHGEIIRLLYDDTITMPGEWRVTEIADSKLVLAYIFARGSQEAAVAPRFKIHLSKPQMAMTQVEYEWKGQYNYKWVLVSPDTWKFESETWANGTIATKVSSTTTFKLKETIETQQSDVSMQIKPGGTVSFGQLGKETVLPSAAFVGKVMTLEGITAAQEGVGPATEK